MYHRNEVWIILKKSGLLSIIECLSFTSGTTATFLTVLALVFTGHILSAATVFMLLAFMSVLRLSISNVLPAVFEIFVSLRRIEKFLLLDNMPFDPLQYDQSSCNHGNTKVYPQLLVREAIRQEIPESDAVDHVAADVKYPVLDRKTDMRLSVCSLTRNLNGNSEKYLLHDVSFEANEKSLTVVTGQIGSGKSTLLAAIAGEAIKSSGDLICSGSVAYVPQTAWVFSGTIRENILFGETYDEKKYTEVVETCALKEDIDRFPNGDLSFVGEHGVVLSGGQRARVNLARAVYADAGVYLLDDPLSAVDAKVGEHIFEQCICRLLGDKIRILVSYAESHMKAADQVVVLHKGSVLGKGSFCELQDGGRILDTIINASNTTSKEKKRATAEGKKDTSFNFTPVQGGFDEYLEISEEDKATGKISSALYWEYFRAGAHPIAMIPLVFLFLAAQGEYAVTSHSHVT